MKADAEIVRRVLQGDRESFETLVARHEKAVWATAWRILRDVHAASDAAQEAFLLAFDHLSELREPALFGVWLLRIARRQSVRLARRQARHGAQPIVEDVSPTANGRMSHQSLDSVSQWVEVPLPVDKPPTTFEDAAARARHDLLLMGSGGLLGVAADTRADASGTRPISHFEPDRIADADYAAAVLRGINDLRRFDEVREPDPHESVPPEGKDQPPSR